MRAAHGSLRSMVPESQLVSTEHGLVPKGQGWFVVNARETQWWERKGRGVLCEFEIAPGARFHGDQGDLLELLGNLLENGFKWAKRRVLLSAHVIPGGSGRRTGMELAVEDDGPGIDADNVDYLLQRGVRGDERVQGHGIGLAIVQDILRAYQGELGVSKSESLGGARFAIRFVPR